MNYYELLIIGMDFTLKLKSHVVPFFAVRPYLYFIAEPFSGSPKIS